VAGPRWWEPRFEGQVVREVLPAGLLDALAARAPASGLRVVEEAPRSMRSYREAAPEQSLLLAPEGETASWDRLEVWQEGAGVLHYEGSMRVWMRLFALPVVGFALLFITLPLVLVYRSWASVAGGTLAAGLWVVAALGRQTMQRQQAKRWVHAFVEGEVMRAQRAVPFGLKRDPPAQPRAPVTLPSTPAALRVAPSDPVLAAAARVSHDAFARHEDRDPEDEVKAIEAAAKRSE
jgi:hypothetical protein